MRRMGRHLAGQASSLQSPRFILKGGTAAGRAEASEITKYANIASTHIAVPLAFETLGAMGRQACDFVSEGRLTSVSALVTDENHYFSNNASRYSHNHNKIGNAIACQGTFPLNIA